MGDRGERSVESDEEYNALRDEFSSVIDSAHQWILPAIRERCMNKAGNHQTLHQHFVKPDFIKEAHEGSYAIRIDIKYARGVRGMEHEETPIATETIKTMRIKSF